MKTFISLLLVVAVCICLYFGWIKFIGQSMKSSQHQTPDINLPKIGEETEDVWKKQKELMEEREQKMRDFRNR